MNANDKRQVCCNFKFVIFVVVLSFSVGISCSPVKQEVLQELNKNVQNKEKLSDEYEKYLERGQNFVGDKEFQKAEESFREALKIAENENWINEIVSVKTKIANVYMFKKNFQESEAMFNSAISTCENNDKCSFERLDATFGFLSFLYLYQMKDISKIQAMINQIKVSKIFASAGQTKEKTCYYIGEIKSAGYEKEANKLFNQEACSQ